jgi:Ca2+-binding EF-hand superfamily protein
MTNTIKNSLSLKQRSLLPASTVAIMAAIGIVLAAPMSHQALAQDETVQQVSDKRGSGARLDRMFQRLDTDEDGVISSAEISARRSAAFDQFDADGDGSLTINEIAAAQEAIREARRTARTLRNVSRARGFSNADADGDGTLSKDEFAEARGRMLSRIDANGDGDITREEAEQARTAMRKMRKHRGGHGGRHGGRYGGGHGGAQD